MSPRKKTTMKPAGVEPSGNSQQTVETKSVRAVYDDTSGLLDKEGETLKWGEVYYMFKKSNFSMEAEDPGDGLHLLVHLPMDLLYYFLKVIKYVLYNAQNAK
jgi:hypothetical protein